MDPHADTLATPTTPISACTPLLTPIIISASSPSSLASPATPPPQPTTNHISSLRIPARSTTAKLNHPTPKAVLLPIHTPLNLKSSLSNVLNINSSTAPHTPSTSIDPLLSPEVIHNTRITSTSTSMIPDPHSFMDDLLVAEIARDSPVIVDPSLFIQNSPPLDSQIPDIYHHISTSMSTSAKSGLSLLLRHRTSLPNSLSHLDEHAKLPPHSLPDSDSSSFPVSNFQSNPDPIPLLIDPLITPRPSSQEHTDHHIQELSTSGGARTVAENLAKNDRSWMPRCTAYVTAPRYRFNDLITYLVTRHKVQVRALDECLYACYPQFCHSPLYATAMDDSLLGDLDGRRVQLDSNLFQPKNSTMVGGGGSKPVVALFPTIGPKTSPISPYSEVCFFSFGCVVMWGMTVKEEQWLLNEIRQFHASDSGPRMTSRVSYHDDTLASSSDSTSIDVENICVETPDFDYLYGEDNMVTEEFHYQYDISTGSRPRIYNDIITLRDGNHLVKVTISHGIAQSCKLLLFEMRMENTLERTRNIPKALAKTGNVQLTPQQVTVLTGQLYQLRMDLNLVSNVLDIPDMFWLSPGWQPLYRAVQKYLEIPQRSKTLNLRASVLSDLLDMLSSHITTAQMDWMTWVVIILIAVSIVVLALEILMKTLKMGVH